MASGQAIQFSPSYKADPENPAYLKTAGLKTASLFTAACELAASLSGYNSSEFEAIKVFGRNFGLAFQIIDDCIDQEFPHQKRKKAVDAAGRLVANAKCSLEVLQNDKTKINLSRLAEIYLEASLPKNS
jgi:geranylgeranyl pyrophosphate synthase